jgi:hypothetical protein
MNTLPTELIEKALALLNVDIEEMSSDVYHPFEWNHNFSIAKFYAYLLSPDFIEKYELIEAHTPDKLYRKWIAWKF